MSEWDREDELVLAAASMFHAAAMQQMGKMINPISGEVERDLAQARFSIDVVAAMLKKTQGLLAGPLHAQLEKMVFELQMNYLQEEKASRSSQEEPPSSDSSAPAEDGPESS